MTYRQLALLAGVSVATVSKALSGSKEISASTTERIRQLAIENGIERPRYRRAEDSDCVAIVAPDLMNNFCSNAINIISETLWQLKKVPKIYLCGNELSKYCSVLDEANIHGCQGIISLYERQYFLHKSSVPILYIPYNKMFYGAFSVDNPNSGVAQAVKHLISLGHTEIGFAGKQNSHTEHDGFKKIIKFLKLDYKHEYTCLSKDKKYSGADELAQYYISAPEMPTALIASDDEVALDLIHSFEKLGIKVPEDISIIGVGDTECASCQIKQLTSVKVVIESYFEMIIKIFAKDISTRSEMPKADYLVPQSTLVIRDTTAAPRGGKT